MDNTLKNIETALFNNNIQTLMDYYNHLNTTSKLNNDLLGNDFTDDIISTLEQHTFHGKPFFQVVFENDNTENHQFSLQLLSLLKPDYLPISYVLSSINNNDEEKIQDNIASQSLEEELKNIPLFGHRYFFEELFKSNNIELINTYLTKISALPTTSLSIEDKYHITNTYLYKSLQMGNDISPLFTSNMFVNSLPNIQEHNINRIITNGNAQQLQCLLLNTQFNLTNTEPSNNDYTTIQDYLKNNINSLLTACISNQQDNAFNTLFSFAEKNFMDIDYDQLFKTALLNRDPNSILTLLYSDMIILGGQDIVNLIDIATDVYEEETYNQYTVDIFKHLVSLSVDFGNFHNEDGLDALDLAIQKNNLDAFKIIVNNHKSLLSNIGEGSALFFAIKYNLPEFVDILLKNGVEIHQTNNNNDTPLTYALQRKHINLDMVKTLLHYHPFINSENKKKETALSLAIQKKALNVVPYLLLAGADITKTPVLYNNGVSTYLNENYEYDTSLVFKETLEIKDFQTLIVLGMRMDITDEDGNNLLHNSIIRRQEDNFILLLKHYLSPNLVNNNGDTPLLLAYKASPLNTFFFKELLNHYHHIDVFHKNHEGKNIFDYLLSKENTYIDQSYIQTILESADDLSGEHYSWLLDNIDKYSLTHTLLNKISNLQEFLSFNNEEHQNIIHLLVKKNDISSFQSLIEHFDTIDQLVSFISTPNAHNTTLFEYLSHLPNKQGLEFLSIIESKMTTFNGDNKVAHLFNDMTKKKDSVKP